MFAERKSSVAVKKHRVDDFLVSQQDQAVEETVSHNWPRNTK